MRNQALPNRRPSPMPSRAELFFQDLPWEGNIYNHLRSFANADPPVFETEWLDFKVGEGPGLDDKVKRQKWSEALSGFGNTEGGVLIWGVEAKPDPVSKLDKVTKIVLCPDVCAMENLLRKSLHEAVDPPISGVQIVAVPGPDGKSGFVVCLIPQGQYQPHRAEQAGKAFFIRIGESFKVPAVSLLRTMFFSKEKPHLVPSLYRNPTDGDVLRYGIQLENRGAASAENIFIRICFPRETRFKLENLNEASGLITAPDGAGFSIGHIIHPEMTRHVGILVNPAKPLLDSEDRFGRPARVTIKTHCRDYASMEWEIFFSGDVIDVIGTHEFRPVVVQSKSE